LRSAEPERSGDGVAKVEFILRLINFDDDKNIYLLDISGILAGIENKQ